MEQQTQGRERQRPEEAARRETQIRTPERERIEGPGLLAQALLEGVPLLEMPPTRLEELAALIGNQGMAALLKQQAPPLEESPFELPPEADTAPFPVPEMPLFFTVQAPEGLSQGEGGRAFDPAGLVY